MWTIFERQQIIGRLATEHGQGCVLPVRLDGCGDEVPGLHKGISYLAVTSGQFQHVVDTLLKKLGEPGYELDSTDAYARAVQYMKKREQGHLEYDKIFTSIDVINQFFSSISCAGDFNIHAIEGHEFLWQRERGQPLKILARNNSTEFQEICRFEAPEVWIGCGRWRLMFPHVEKDPAKMKEEDKALIVLFLFAADPAMFSTLSKQGGSAVFLSALFLGEQNAVEFFSLAEEKYDNLR